MRKMISKLGSHVVEGVEYPNLPSIAKAYGLKFNSVYKRYSRGCRGDNLVPKKKSKNYKPKKKEIKYKLYVNGVGYKSKQDACRKNNVNYVTFRKRYEEYGWSLERSLSIPSGLTKGGQGIFSSTEIKVKDKTYKSIAEAARYYNLTPETVAAALKKGATINQAFKLEIKPTENSFNFEGKFYRDKKHFCKKFNFPYTLLRNRLNRGLSLRQALNLGKSNIGNDGRYNKKIFKKNPELANKNAYLYFAVVKIDKNIRYKIGITSKSIKQRLSKEFTNFKVIKNIKSSLYQCYLIERKLLDIFSEYRDLSVTSDKLDGYKEIFDFPDNIVTQIQYILDKNFKNL